MSRVEVSELWYGEIFWTYGDLEGTSRVEDGKVVDAEVYYPDVTLKPTLESRIIRVLQAWYDERRP